nr:chemotaxis protein CheB [Hymenobacter sp. AT01-02]
MAPHPQKSARKHLRDIVVIGASAGGVTALLELVRMLPADFPASILVVQHLAADSPSMLPQLLSTRLPCPPSTLATEKPSRPVPFTLPLPITTYSLRMTQYW